jgi:DNA transformation protein
VSERLAALRNLGPDSEATLHRAGITSPLDLERLGSVEAYRRVLERGTASWNVVGLWALEGALLDLPWNGLPAERREELRELAARIRAGEPGVSDPGFVAPTDSA